MRSGRCIDYRLHRLRRKSVVSSRRRVTFIDCQRSRLLRCPLRLGAGVWLRRTHIVEFTAAETLEFLLGNHRSDAHHHLRSDRPLHVEACPATVPTALPALIVDSNILHWFAPRIDNAIEVISLRMTRTAFSTSNFIKLSRSTDLPSGSSIAGSWNCSLPWLWFEPQEPESGPAGTVRVTRLTRVRPDPRTEVSASWGGT